MNLIDATSLGSGFGSCTTPAGTVAVHLVVTGFGGKGGDSTSSQCAGGGGGGGLIGRSFAVGPGVVINYVNADGYGCSLTLTDGSGRGISAAQGGNGSLSAGGAGGTVNGSNSDISIPNLSDSTKTGGQGGAPSVEDSGGGGGGGATRTAHGGAAQYNVGGSPNGGNAGCTMDDVGPTHGGNSNPSASAAGGGGAGNKASWKTGNFGGVGSLFVAFYSE